MPYFSIIAEDKMFVNIVLNRYDGIDKQLIRNYNGRWIFFEKYDDERKWMLMESGPSPRTYYDLPSGIQAVTAAVCLRGYKKRQKRKIEMS